jgi:hypothetical protein
MGFINCLWMCVVMNVPSEQFIVHSVKDCLLFAIVALNMSAFETYALEMWKIYNPLTYLHN